MAAEKRPYQKKQRAELEDRTRLRITESAVALHGSLGPSRTSISAVAQHAGVRRSTVYRHFPDEAALFAACSSHWAAANPPPDLSSWAAIGDPGKRLSVALRGLYAHYRRTERMMENILRDEEIVPAVKQTFRGFREYMAAARDVLMGGRNARGRSHKRVLAAIGHTVAFSTWHSLVREQDLADSEAADLMCDLVRAATQAPSV